MLISLSGGITVVLINLCWSRVKQFYH